MSIRLVELDQADQLSACRLSLLLGLNTEHNLIKRFLKFGQKLSSMQTAMLYFHDEPYFWHYEAGSLQGVYRDRLQDLSQFFDKALCIDEQHRSFAALSACLAQSGLTHQRIVAVDLKKSDQRSIGMALFLDQNAEQISEMTKELLIDHCHDFARYIELKANYEELNELYEQQCALNFSKTKFFSIISHDLRAPFHGLLGFSEVLAKERETLDESSIQNIADYLYDTSQSTYNLLESLLNWAMAEGGRFVYHPINFSLKQVSAIVLSVLKTFAIKKNIQLIEEVPDQLKVYADMNMITSVIQNLVSNALKFTHVDGTGKVYIQAVQAETGVEIYVRDTGLGMTEQQMENIFHPRITVSFKGTEGEKGAGLGLALCKRFIDLNRGEISVSSKESEGTIFKVILPSAQDGLALLTEQKTNSDVKMV